MVRVQKYEMVFVTDRIGQVWEITIARRPPIDIAYLVLGSTPVEFEGETVTNHSFLSLRDGSVQTWCEREDRPYEGLDDRRRVG